MPPRVVAVVCSYWISRLGNIQQIVNDLHAGTVVPDRILVLNNNKETKLEIDGADVINSEFNSRTRGKFLVALMDVADYYLILDDDTSVGPETLEKYLSVADRDSCHAPYGKFVGEKRTIFWNKIEEETPCEYLLGIGLFVSYKCVVRMLLADDWIRRPTEWKHQAEDILIGLVNKPSVIPLNKKEEFVDLPWGTEAMDWGSDGITEGKWAYYEMRDNFTADALEVLEEHPIPDY